MTANQSSNHYPVFFIEELLNIFFNQCGQDPKQFVANFDHSNYIIGYNYGCEEKRFTHVSASFKRILGYNQTNILNNGNFTQKIVHPQDKDVIQECLRKSFRSSHKSIETSDKLQFKYVKCRAHHIRGYWKYFIIYAQDYWNKADNVYDKIGIIVDERIKPNWVGKSANTAGNFKDNPPNGLKSLVHNTSATSGHISPREYEVLELISNGLITKEIAAKLHISDSTVITHRKHLITKLNVHNTAELIKEAARYMLI